MKKIKCQNLYCEGSSQPQSLVKRLAVWYDWTVIVKSVPHESYLACFPHPLNANMNITICEIDHQSRFNAWDRVLRAGALGRPWGMGWGGMWEGGSGWGTHVHPWLIHVNVRQKPLQYCKVIQFSSVQSLSRVRLFATPWSTACQASPVHHQPLEFTQTHVIRVRDAIQPSHPVSPPSPPAPNPSQHQSFPMSQLFAWGGQSTGVSALASFLPKNTQGWFPLE